MMKAITALALALAMVSGVSPALAEDPARNDVYESIRDRLALMKPVAAWKAARKVPIEDLDREKIVVQSSMRNAEAVRIDGLSAKSFFEAQIAAAKEIQSCWIDRWASGKAKAPEAVRDLVSDIRPRLIELGAQILKDVAFAFKESEDRPFAPGQESEFVAAIEIDCLSDDSKREFYRALLAVQPLE